MIVRAVGDDLGVLVGQQLRSEFLNAFRRDVQGSGDMCFAVAFRREGLDYRDSLLLVEFRLQVFGRNCAVHFDLLKNITAGLHGFAKAKMQVQCHNVVNGFGGTNRSSRRDPANPTAANRHHCVDECGGSGIAVRDMEGTESCAARLRWGQWHRAFLGGSSAMEILRNGTHEHTEKQAAHVAGALLSPRSGLLT